MGQSTGRVFLLQLAGVQRMGSPFGLCVTCTKMIVSEPAEELVAETTYEPLVMYSYAREPRHVSEESEVINMRNKWLGCNETRLGGPGPGESPMR